MKVFIAIVVLFWTIAVVYAEPCNISIEIITSKLLYENESVDFKFKPSSKISDFKIEYWVEDFDQNIIKAKRNSTNVNKKSFRPKASGIQPFLVKAKFTQLNCTFPEITYEKTVLYKGEEETASMCCACPIKSKGFHYSLAEEIDSVYSGQEFTVKVKLENYDKEKHEVKIWSYVYRGSKVYSESREANLQQITILPNSTIAVELENRAIADLGNYKFKVKINKDDQKTNKELTTNISIVEKHDMISSLPKIRISDLYFVTESPVNLITMLNNSLKEDINLDVELISLYSFQKKTVFVESESEALLNFEVELSEEKNPFFVKIYLNETLIDVEEIIIEDVDKAPEKPFQLFTGDVTLMNSSNVYESSSEKSIKIATYLFLALSVVLNCLLIIRKKIKLL